MNMMPLYEFAYYTRAIIVFLISNDFTLAVLDIGLDSHDANI